jgi:hypothetical protein
VFEGDEHVELRTAALEVLEGDDSELSDDNEIACSASTAMRTTTNRRCRSRLRRGWSRTTPDVDGDLGGQGASRNS